MEAGQLDGVDRRLVHALVVAPRAPFRQLAAVLDVSDQTVRRRYRSLRAEAGLRVLGRLDGSRVGRVDWIVRLQCTPDTAVGVATALAARPDTSWVSLASGGTEIVCLLQPRDAEQRDLLLVERLSGSRRVLAVSAHALLHTFSSVAWHGYAEALNPAEVTRLQAGVQEPPAQNLGGAAAPVRLTPSDEILAGLLVRDGRMSAASLAVGTGGHESTVRRRIAHLVRTGVLYFDLDLDHRALGQTIPAHLWISAEPGALTAVGTAIASHHEAPFVGATTGPTNLLASIVCADAAHLYRYLTTQIAGLPGIRHVETAPTIRTLKRAGSMEPH